MPKYQVCYTRTAHYQIIVEADDMDDADEVAYETITGCDKMPEWDEWDTDSVTEICDIEEEINA